MFKKHLLKFMALLLSISFWFYVFNTSSYEEAHKFHLEIITKRGLAVGNIVGSEIEVRVKAPRSLMRSYFKEERSITLSPKRFGGSETGDYEIEIGDRDVPVPFGMKVIDIRPKILKIKLEKMIRKKVPVKVELVGELPIDYKLMSYSISPKEVMIEGPIETMRKIAAVSTRPIDISNLKGVNVLDQEIFLPDTRVKTKDDVSFEFSYHIVPKGASLKLENVPVRFLSINKSYFPEISEVTITLIVSDKEKFQEKRDKISIIADLPGNPGKYKIKLESKLPEGIHLLQIRPQYINVVVR